MDPQDRKHPETLWTAEQVADCLGWHAQTVYRKARAGVLPSFKMGQALRFRPSEIEAWVKEEEARTESTQVAERSA